MHKLITSIIKLVFLALLLTVSGAIFVGSFAPDPNYGQKLSARITSSCKAEYPYDDNLAMDCAIRLMGRALGDAEREKLGRAARNAGVE